MLKTLSKKIQNILDNMNQDYISEASAQCAYYVILSFIPFLILLLTLIQYTNLEPWEMFDIISKLVPDNLKEIVLGIIMEVYSKSLGTVSVSLIFTLISADKGLFALTKELHLIYNYTDNNKKSWLNLKITSILQTFLFIVIIALGLVIMVFGRTIISEINTKYGVYKNYELIYELGTRITLFSITFLIFLCIYKFMSRHKLKFKGQIKGAIFASILLNIISYVFSRFLEIFKGFSTTYGSLTTLIIIMMWTYGCFYIIFIGAEINKINGEEYVRKNGRIN